MKTFTKAFRYAPLVCAIFFSACKEDNVTPTAPPELTAVKVMHAAPFNKVKVDALLGSQKLADVTYGTRTPSYVTKGIGNGILTLKDAATQADLLTVPQAIRKDKLYSLFIYNPTSSTLGALVTADSDTPGPALTAGKAGIRLVNLGFDAGAVTLVPQGAGAAPLITNVAYAGASSFVAVDAKDYVLSVRQAASPEAELVSKSVTLIPGASYTVLLRGRNSTTAPADEQLTFDLIQND